MSWAWFFTLSVGWILGMMTYALIRGMAMMKLIRQDPEAYMRIQRETVADVLEKHREK